MSNEHHDIKMLKISGNNLQSTQGGTKQNALLV